nr:MULTISPECIES: copper resistance protein B [Cupriavidus]
MGSGVSEFKLGLRLRYEIRRQFAPDLGVVWGKKLGNTADFALAPGSGPPTSKSLPAGASGSERISGAGQVLARGWLTASLPCDYISYPAYQGQSRANRMATMVTRRP